MNKKPYYITTTLPYVNARPHMGHTLEFIQADAIARYHRLLGEDVVFNTGTDEHGVKIYRKALEEGKEPKAYCDEYSQTFYDLKDVLNLSFDTFVRTTDPHHIAAAQAFWNRCYENGDIYKKKYQVKYCVGCELEKTDSELVDDKCPVHPNMDVELIEEENYFFKFLNYQEKLLELYKTNPDFVVPAHRLKEISNFVASGLQDFSISRLKEKMPWGVAVPNDEDHVMYVWFDALVNYISTIGWPENTEEFEKNWPGYQVAGKDNLRQQSAMWQAMLMSAGIVPSKQIFIHGFITSGGQKMSKSLGNVVDPYAVVEKYGSASSPQVGVDPLRYYLLGALPSHEDGDFTEERFEEFYTAHLVNGVGNLTFRILTMVEKYYHEGSLRPGSDQVGSELLHDFWERYNEAFATYDFENVVARINGLVKKFDTLISEQKPWEKAKNGEDISGLLYQLAEGLRHIGIALLPIIPASAEKILNQLGIDVTTLEDLEIEKEWGRLQSGAQITKGAQLFPRLLS